MWYFAAFLPNHFFGITDNPGTPESQTALRCVLRGNIDILNAFFGEFLRFSGRFVVPERSSKVNLQTTRLRNLTDQEL